MKDNKKEESFWQRFFPPKMSLKNELADLRANTPLWAIIKSNFFGGLAWGLGSVIGATFLFGGLVFLLNSYHDLPLLGNFIGSIARAVKAGLEQVP